MTLIQFAFLGGIWLSLLYAATVMPATIWVIQLTVSRGWWSGIAASAGLALGQLPWALLASLILFQFPGFWQSADLVLRGAAVLFLAWFAYKSARAPRVKALQLVVQGSRWGILKSSTWKSLLMPWRFPVWAGLLITMSIHLRGPGWEAAVLFTAGTFIGQMAWALNFVFLAGLFGHRVPEDITLHSMNKLRLLAIIVPAGLILVILAPVVTE